jgi:hypothetical protein
MGQDVDVVVLVPSRVGPRAGRLRADPVRRRVGLPAQRAGDDTVGADLALAERGDQRFDLPEAAL